MRYMIITIGIIISSHVTFAQKIVFGCPKIYRLSKDVFDNMYSECLKHLRVNIFTNAIAAVREDNSRTIVSPDSVWGYRRKNDYPVRLVSKTEYTLFVTSPLFVYRRGLTKTRSYYFSTDLDSKLFSLTKKELRKAFPNDSIYNHIVSDKSIRRFL